MNYYNIIVDNKSYNTDLPYTYASDADLQIGSKVYVNFSNRKKLSTGYVVESHVNPTIKLDGIKNIVEVDEDKSLNQEIIKTAKWIKQRYGVRFIDAIKLFTVSGERPNEKIIKKIYSNDNDPIELNEEQTNAKKSICKSIEMGEQRAFLINGVTNSGKTEIYMEAISKALELNKTAIYLVPEIALTKQTKERLINRFGEENIAIIHSKLVGSERLKQWLRIKKREAKIVIGTRSAIFAPLENIGAIIIDEEHEATYKADKTPKYETIDIAFKRAKNHNAVIVMGSATPSVVSYNRSLTGIYERIEIKNRVGGGELPQISVIDMRDETKKGNFSPFSEALYKEIDNTVKGKQQVILFINRRGYYTAVQCLECGYRVNCERCGVAMTYHKNEDEMICHYCGKKEKVIKKCPRCGSKYIKMGGMGTEKVEEEIKKIFKEYSIDRIDLDIAKKQSEVDSILSRFSKGETDILIGTQIIAKGLDFKNVGLVGIISADISLNIPDYRSSERTFQLITQVAGRAGRGIGNGNVIIQTYNPDNYAIKSAMEYDYEAFYNIEINHRKTMKYPPFTDIIVVMFISDNYKVGWGYANECKDKLKPDSQSVIYEVKGISRYKMNNKYQCYFMIKCSKNYRNKCIKELSSFRSEMKECILDIDVNPYGII